jgi:LuxR family transcriptional regulator, maltose regulon positive regulatory protein
MSESVEMWAQPLQVKVHIPQPRFGAVTRTRLIERLNEALAHGSRLTILVAPAGYGKSSLLAEWVNASQRPVAWLALDRRDNDLPSFLRYCVAALRTQFPEACPVTFGALHAPNTAAPEYLAELLASELADLPRPCIVVLDDYHLLNAPEVQMCMARLVQTLPETVHLALACRFDPLLPLARFEARGQLCELRGEDLRFSLAEATAFLTHNLSADLSAEVIAALHGRTEGWIALLQLAAQALRGRRDLADPLAHILAQTDRHVAAYLLEEFLAQQAEPVQDFLLRTSILDALCAPLCGAVTGSADIRAARAYLAQLSRLNPLLLELDDRQYWYRYHHLLQDFLRATLARRQAPDEIAALHRRASAWYAASGLIDEALEHALAAGDMRAAIHLVENSVPPAVKRAQVIDLEPRLRRLPPEVLNTSPTLLMGQVFIAQASDEFLRLPALLEAAEAGLQRMDWQPDEDTRLFVTGAIHLSWSLFYRYTNQNLLSEQQAERAIQTVSRKDMFVRGAALVYWAPASQALGRGPEAVSRLREELATCAPGDLAYMQLILLALAQVYRFSGELLQLAEVGRQMLDMSLQAGVKYRISWARTMLGLARYQTNDLEAALPLFEAVVAEPASAHGLALRDSVAGLALSYQAQGLAEQARAVVANHLEFLGRTRRGAEYIHARALQALLALRQGDLDGAERAVELADAGPDPGIMEWLLVPQLVLARVRLARGDKDFVGQAMDICDKVADRAVALHNGPRQIETHVLRALAYETQERTPEALAALSQALKLGLPGGYVRCFLDLEAPMQGGASLQRLLQILVDQPGRNGSRRELPAAYTRRILDALQAEPRPNLAAAAAAEATAPEVAGADARPAPRVVRDGTAAYVETLTQRELDVLRLLAQRYSYKEIALQLVVTPGTVKVHATHIYGKLQADNRSEAVARARSLGILGEE